MKQPLKVINGSRDELRREAQRLLSDFVTARDEHTEAQKRDELLRVSDRLKPKGKLESV